VHIDLLLSIQIYLLECQKIPHTNFEKNETFYVTWVKEKTYLVNSHVRKSKFILFYTGQKYYFFPKNLRRSIELLDVHAKSLNLLTFRFIFEQSIHPDWISLSQDLSDPVFELIL
jgi:hypothetical protein